MIRSNRLVTRRVSRKGNKLLWAAIAVVGVFLIGAVIFFLWALNYSSPEMQKERVIQSLREATLLGNGHSVDGLTWEFSAELTADVEIAAIKFYCGGETLLINKVENTYYFRPPTRKASIFTKGPNADNCRVWIMAASLKDEWIEMRDFPYPVQEVVIP